jgi:nitroimidazol reductase NimA-like FMN-containing flavoprotein (pyridoxamine 5'-phosphate oxidase superfamily)
VASPRRLSTAELEELLAADVPAQLATIDADGFPHVTPLWFQWTDGAFHMTSFAGRSHLRRLALNARAGLCVDIEAGERADGERPNRQVRAIGEAQTFPDAGGEWTERITRKYVTGPGLSVQLERRLSAERIVIRLEPERLVAVASV